MDRQFFTTAVIAVFVALIALIAVPTQAQANPKVAKKLERMNRVAMENYDLLDYEAAKRALTEAIALAKRKRLRGHPVQAQTHLYLAIVELSGFGDKESAAVHLMEAVEIDAKVKIPAAYRTDELDSALSQAREEVSTDEPAGPGPAVEAEDAVDCDDLVGIKHDLIDEADAGAERKVVAWLAMDVKARRVSLYYRPQGASDFVEVALKRKGDCRYQGSIPGSDIAGDFLHYFVAAHGKGGKVLASRGSKGSPNIIEVAAGTGGGGSSETVGEGGEARDDEDPFASRDRAESRGGGSRSGSDVATSVLTGGKAGSFFVSIAVGGGGAYITGDTEQAQRPVKCCVAPGFPHVYPEVGMYVRPQIGVSLGARLGLPIGANMSGRSPLAPAGVFRVRYAMSEDHTGLQLSGSLGAGVMRQTVKVENPPEKLGGDRDTIASGPLLVGGGLHYVEPVGGPILLVAELTTLVGVPVVDSFFGVDQMHFSVQADFNVGLVFAF